MSLREVVDLVTGLSYLVISGSIVALWLAVRGKATLEGLVAFFRSDPLWLGSLLAASFGGFILLCGFYHLAEFATRFGVPVPPAGVLAVHLGMVTVSAVTAQVVATLAFLYELHVRRGG